MESQELPTLYKRKYVNTKDVSSGDLRAAYQTAAQLVADHGDQYLPLFERLDQELQRRAEKDRMKDRALALAEITHSKDRKAVNPDK